MDKNESSPENAHVLWSDVVTSSTSTRTEIDSELAHGVLMTPRQTAEYLSVGVHSVYRWCKTGDLGCFQMPGGGIRISGSHLHGFLRERGGALAAEQQEVDASGGRIIFTGIDDDDE